jgi:hypothetical protein
LIGLGDFVFRVGKPFGELRVVGKNQQAARIQIQPSHGKHVCAQIGGEIIDGGPSLRVLVGGEIPFGFVEEQI